MSVYPSLLKWTVYPNLWPPMTTIVEKITMVVRSALELNPKFFKVSSFVFKLMKQFFARVAEICLVTSVLTNILFYAYQNK